MSSISKDPRKKFVNYFSYVGKWLDGLPAEQIAAELGFDSPAAMYQRLQQDGFMVCEECGETPVKSDHYKKHKRRRRATQTGEAIELPPTTDAAELLQGVIDELVAAVDDLDTRRETYRAGRFEQADVYQDPVYFFRSRFTDEQWRSICERLGQGPEQESFILRDVKTLNALGATQSPRETALIAAYVVLGKQIDPLLEALHPDPPNADRGKLLKGQKKQKPKVQELLIAAHQVARLVRGGTVGAGAPTEKLSARELNAAWYITSQRKAGLPEKEIQQALREQGFTLDEINRLGKMRLSPPSS